MPITVTIHVPANVDTIAAVVLTDTSRSAPTAAETRILAGTEATFDVFEGRSIAVAEVKGDPARIAPETGAREPTDAAAAPPSP